jgi:DNA-binding winged helix-turn-helix (wHTH) protein
VFGGFEVDEALQELRREGRPVELHATPLRLLLYLLRNRDRVIPKEELLDHVWPEAVVSEDALFSALKEIRHALGEAGSKQRALETLRGRGYRLIAPVEEHRAAAHPARAGAALAQLDACLEDAQAGRGRIVLLAGEAGIGKTRTAEEFAAAARSRGVPVRAAWCREEKGALPYWPWVKILRGLVDGRDADALRRELGSGAAQIARIVPEIRERLPDLPKAPAEADPEEARFRLFDAIVGFLGRASAREARILIVDDLHGASGSSLQLLDFLAHEIASMQILLLGTYRDVEIDRDHPLAGSLAELIRHDVCVRIPMQGLDADEVRELVHRLAGLDPPEDLVAMVLEKTDGNPFFIRELVSLFAERHAESRPVDAAGRELEVPTRVREVIRGRLRRLSPACNQALEIASAVGREFAIELLERASELDRDSLAEALGEAHRAGLVDEAPKAGYRFAHALTREAVYAEQGSHRRAQLHGRIGEALECLRAADPAPHLAELARHFGLAGNAEKTLDYAMRAGHRAMDQLAFEEAASLYAHALHAFDHLGRSEVEERGEILQALGRAWLWSDDLVAAKRILAEAAAANRASGGASLLERAALARVPGPARLGGIDPELSTLLEEALEALPSERNPPSRVRILSRLSAKLWYSQPSRAAALLDQALAASRGLADDATLSRTLLERALALDGPDTAEEVRAHHDELLPLAAGMGDDVLAFQNYRYRGEYLLARGEMIALDSEIEAMRRLAERRDSLLGRALVAGLDGMRALLEGRFERAEVFARQGLALLVRNPDPAGLARAGGQLAVLLFQCGRFEELGAVLEQLNARFPDLLLARCTQARFECETGQPERARSFFETLAARGFSPLPRDASWLLSMALLSEVCQALGDAQRGAQLYESLRPYHALAASAAEAVFYGSISHHLGGLATLLSEPAAAAAHFEKALAMHRRMGARPWLAYTQHDFAHMLLVCGEARDRDRARELAGDALATARELGMLALAERTEALRQEIQSAIRLRTRRRSSI